MYLSGWSENLVKLYVLQCIVPLLISEHLYRSAVPAIKLFSYYKITFNRTKGQVGHEYTRKQTLGGTKTTE